jgi:hypothetical protein
VPNARYVVSDNQDRDYHFDQADNFFQESVKEVVFLKLVQNNLDFADFQKEEHRACSYRKCSQLIKEVVTVKAKER